MFIVALDDVPVGTEMQKKGVMGPHGTLVRSEVTQKDNST